MSYSLTSMNPVCTSPSANISCEASLPRNSMLVPTPATYGSVKMGIERSEGLGIQLRRERQSDWETCTEQESEYGVCANLVALERLGELFQGSCSVLSPDNQFGYHRIVVFTDFIPCVWRGRGEGRPGCVYVCVCVGRGGGGCVCEWEWRDICKESV